MYHPFVFKFRPAEVQDKPQGNPRGIHTPPEIAANAGAYFPLVEDKADQYFAVEKGKISFNEFRRILLRTVLRRPRNTRQDHVLFAAVAAAPVLRGQGADIAFAPVARAELGMDFPGFPVDFVEDVMDAERARGGVPVS
ncbi:hypothetical protein AGMMS50268_39280 [Spirochaetia bacterium]|nr:hypothetical protein AGMMS50268_39280 [Spirochaetia bacterium]